MGKGMEEAENLLITAVKIVRLSGLSPSVLSTMRVGDLGDTQQGRRKKDGST